MIIKFLRKRIILNIKKKMIIKYIRKNIMLNVKE
jgi:hypothetical protein